MVISLRCRSKNLRPSPLSSAHEYAKCVGIEGVAASGKRRSPTVHRDTSNHEIGTGQDDEPAGSGPPRNPSHPSAVPLAGWEVLSRGDGDAVGTEATVGLSTYAEFENPTRAGLSPAELENLANVEDHLRDTDIQSLEESIVDLKVGIHEASRANANVVQTDGFLPMSLAMAVARVDLYLSELQRQRECAEEPFDVAMIVPSPTQMKPNQWWGVERHDGEIKQIRNDLRPSKLDPCLPASYHKDNLRYWLKEQPRLDSFRNKGLSRAVKSRIKKLRSIIVELENQARADAAKRLESEPTETRNKESQTTFEGTHLRTDDEIRSDPRFTPEERDQILYVRQLSATLDSNLAAQKARRAERMARSAEQVVALLESVLGRAPFEANTRLTDDETTFALRVAPPSLDVRLIERGVPSPLQICRATREQLRWAYRVVRKVESRLGSLGPGTS